MIWKSKLLVKWAGKDILKDKSAKPVRAEKVLLKTGNDGLRNGVTPKKNYRNIVKQLEWAKNELERNGLEQVM